MKYVRDVPIFVTYPPSKSGPTTHADSIFLVAFPMSAQLAISELRRTSLGKKTSMTQVPSAECQNVSGHALHAYFSIFLLRGKRTATEPSWDLDFVNGGPSSCKSNYGVAGRDPSSCFLAA